MCDMLTRDIRFVGIVINVVLSVLHPAVSIRVKEIIKRVMIANGSKRSG